MTTSLSSQRCDAPHAHNPAHTRRSLAHRAVLQRSGPLHRRSAPPPQVTTGARKHRFDVHSAPISAAVVGDEQAWLHMAHTLKSAAARARVHREEFMAGAEKQVEWRRALL